MDKRRDTGSRQVLLKRLAFSLAAGLLIFVMGRELAPGFFLFSVGAQPQVSQPLPEFTSSDPDHWLNSPPFRVEDLKGKVVFLDVWTFG